MYVVEDLDGYWAYLEFPAHVREELWGIPHLEKFAAIDVSDSDDPELTEKIAALQARHQQEHPEIAQLAGLGGGPVEVIHYNRRAGRRQPAGDDGTDAACAAGHQGNLSGKSSGPSGEGSGGVRAGGHGGSRAGHHAASIMTAPSLAFATTRSRTWPRVG